MRLVVDSAVQLPWEMLDAMGVQVVDYPMYLNGEPFPASMRMSRAEKDALRLLLKDKANKVTTSGLSEEDLVARYEACGGERILSLHQAARASTATRTVIQQILARRKDLDVTYLDAHHLTAAYSVLVLDTARAVASGAPVEEVVARFERSRARTRHLGVVYDLFYLHRTGRIGLARALAGTVMQMIPLLGSSEEPGVLRSIGKVRNAAQANRRFAALVEEDLQRFGSRRLLAVVSVIGPHEAEAEDLRASIEGLGCEAEIVVTGTNHSNMPHAGPDFYDLGYIVLDD